MIEIILVQGFCPLKIKITQFLDDSFLIFSFFLISLSAGENKLEAEKLSERLQCAVENENIRFVSLFSHYHLSIYLTD